MSKKIITDVEVEEKTEGLLLSDVALLLTLLDEKRHNQRFYKRFDKDVEGYTSTIERIQRIISNQIQPAKIVPFLEANNHLAEHFVSRKHEFDYKEVAHLFQLSLFDESEDLEETAEFYDNMINHIKAIQKYEEDNSKNPEEEKRVYERVLGDLRERYSAL